MPKFIEIFGYACAAYGLYAASKWVRVLNSDCDLVTRAAKLPKDAYIGKICWVTGASSGIGKALASQLAEQGAKVIISARSLKGLEAAKAEILKACGVPDSNIVVLPLDLGDLDSLPAKADTALAAFGGMDMLVNNAGVTAFILGKNMKMEVLKSLMTVNFIGQVTITQKVLPALLENKGTILNVVSRAGVIGGLPYRTGYCASKFAMMGYFEALRSEHMEELSITNILPGHVRTNFCQASITETGQSFQSQNKSGKKLFDMGAAHLTPERVADRSLAAAHNNVWNVWIWSNIIEMLCFYANTYSPEISKFFLVDGATKLRNGMTAAIDASKKDD